MHNTPPGHLTNSIVVVSDFLEDHPAPPFSFDPYIPAIYSYPQPVNVVGGYLERLPLAAVKTGMVDHAEIWHHHRSKGIASWPESAALTRRAFAVDSDAPFHSEAMLEFIAAHGAPRVLAVWGLGVSEAVLQACHESFIIYNSIDAPALRVPNSVSRHFDLVITGAQWQSDEVQARHPNLATVTMPIGPEFASPETFFPIPQTDKPYDVVYVAAAQPYKRHDILFAALQRSARPLKALCIIGYGEDAERLRALAANANLDVDFIGPPGVPHAEVNRLINHAKVGVVCGVDDGAPAILTEYMLAGLPVVANVDLRCGLQYIRPDTGLAVPADQFELGILAALDGKDFAPRQAVLDRWTWQHSISRLASLIGSLDAGRSARQVQPELA